MALARTHFENTLDGYTTVAFRPGTQPTVFAYGTYNQRGDRIAVVCGLRREADTRTGDETQLNLGCVLLRQIANSTQIITNGTVRSHNRGDEGLERISSTTTFVDGDNIIRITMPRRAARDPGRSALLATVSVNGALSTIQEEPYIGPWVPRENVAPVSPAPAGVADAMVPVAATASL